MSRLTRIQPEFVTFAPDELEAGVLYVSMEYATVLHRCCCGCGNTVVTPLARARWQLMFDGESISLSPSIGNWSFACQSHYWIKKNEVRWDRSFSEPEIARGRMNDQRAMQRQEASDVDHRSEHAVPTRPGWIERVRRFFSRNRGS
jgi:hypothetical protein